MRQLTAHAVAVLLATAAVVAPSASGAAPQPRDFEMAVDPSTAAAPAAARARAGGTFHTRTLRAPARFDLVGLRWRGLSEPDVELRVRRKGGHWTRWRSLPVEPDHAPDPGAPEAAAVEGTGPAWAAGSDYVQLRLSERPPGLRLHFVRTAGTAPVKRAARAGGSSRASPAQAGAQPAINPRAAWGAESCPPRSGPAYGQVQVALVHHTVNMNSYSREQVPALILGICRYHRNSNGWNDIGYNFLVDKFGQLWEGRAGGIDQPVIGAQASGFNSKSFAVSNVGDHSSAPQTGAALDAMAALIRWKLPLHGQPTSGRVTVTSSGGTPVTLERVSGHRDVNSTACPGAALYSQLPLLRSKVGDSTPTRTRPSITLKRSRAGTGVGKTAVLSGTILPRKEQLTMLVSVKRGERFVRRDRIPLTVKDGRFSKRFRFPTAGTWRFRVRFGGDEANRASNSAPVYVSAVRTKGGGVSR